MAKPCHLPLQRGDRAADGEKDTIAAQVGGGVGEVYEKFELDVSNRFSYGNRQEGYCKYCKEIKTLKYIGETDEAWFNGRSAGDCGLWKCDRCWNVNYYRLSDGMLI